MRSSSLCKGCVKSVRFFWLTLYLNFLCRFQRPNLKFHVLWTRYIALITIFVSCIYLADNIIIENSVSVTVTGWYHASRPVHCDHFMIYFEFPIWVLIILICPPKLSGSNQQRHLVARLGETWREMSTSFADEISLSYSAGPVNMP
jgi:hypothetical protein